MQKVVFKHLGLEGCGGTVLDRMGFWIRSFLVGDYAKGNDSGLIENFNRSGAEHGIHRSIRR